jgi:hypothetical protein
MRRFYKTLKSQIPSTKLFKYPMTKTGTAVGPNCFAKLALPSILPFGPNVDRSFVWNFEFGSLGFV